MNLRLQGWLTYINFAAALIIIIWFLGEILPVRIVWGPGSEGMNTRSRKTESFKIGEVVGEANTPVSLSRASAIVEQTTRGEARAIKVFPGPGQLTGMVIDGRKPDSEQLVAWTDGEHIIAGPVVTTTGLNLTKRAEEIHLSNMNQEELSVPSNLRAHGSSSAQKYEQNYEKLYANLRNAASIEQFSGPKKLFVFYDAGCRFCHEMYKQVTRYKQEFSEKDVSIRWVPIQLLSDETGRQGQAHLSGGLKELKAHFGGIESTAVQKPELENSVLGNTKLLFENIPRAGTPTVVYKTKQGVKVHIGTMKDEEMESLLQEVI